MTCKTPALDMELEKAENRKGYQIRKAINNKVYKKAFEIIYASCPGTNVVRHNHLEVFRNKGNGIGVLGVKWYGRLVFNSNYGNITTCHWDQEWSDALDALLEKTRQEKRVRQASITEKKRKINALNRAFG